jgi:DHA1 family bicyclomycin/chloramphenicol resistance-like MFS transporter
VRALTDARFLAAAFAAALNFTAVFLYISSAPVFLMRHLGLRETQFYWLFIPIPAGMMLGAALSGHLAGRVTPSRTVLFGYGGMIFAAAVNVALHALRPAGLPWSVLPLFVYTIGMAFAMPSLVLFGLDIFPAQKGLASSCQTFLMSGINALTAGLLAPYASATPLRLAITSAALTLTGFLCTLLFFSRSSNAAFAAPAST